MTPDQLQWVLDHNMQIRAGHRVQIAEAVQAWRADRELAAELLQRLNELCRMIETVRYSQAYERSSALLALHDPQISPPLDEDEREALKAKAEGRG